jgi:hypothetical protein
MCITLPGCSWTSGNIAILNPRVVEQIEKGVSTKKDLIRLFGPAKQIIHNTDGSEVWVYEYTNFGYFCLGPMGIALGDHFCDSGGDKFTLVFQVTQSGVVLDYKQSVSVT